MFLERERNKKKNVMCFFSFSTQPNTFILCPFSLSIFFTKPTRLCKLNRFPFKPKPKPKLLLHNNIISAYAFKTPSLAYCTTCLGFGLAKFLIFFSCVFYSVVSISLAYSFIWYKFISCIFLVYEGLNYLTHSLVI